MNIANGSEPALRRPPSLAALAEGRLREGIENAEFELGAPLSEDKLATFLGISRTPVREALNSLSLQGLVEIYPQRGSYVFSPSGADVQQLCEFRMMMESKAMGLCLVCSKDETAHKLIRANAAMQTAWDIKDRKAAAQSDTAFHMAFFEGCGNQFLQQAYALIAGRITALRTHLVNPNTGVSHQAVREHTEIIEAFAADNIAQAESILSAHIHRMGRIYTVWKSSGANMSGQGVPTRPARKRTRQREG